MVWDHVVEVQILVWRPSFNGLLVIVVAHVLCKHEAGVRFSHGPPRLNSYNAWLAQLVERNVANVQVAGSNPVPRTKFISQ